MIEILPLKGILYNTKKIEDLSRVIAPPHDVISPEERDALRSRSKFNFTHLDSPDGRADRYRRAAGLFRAWEKRQILVQDKEASIYVYDQTYRVQNREHARTGFIGLLKLESLGQGVLPHEKILEKGLQDRISLIAATKANFGVPLLLYAEKERRIDGILREEVAPTAPCLEFVDNDRTRHRLWRVSRPGVIRKIGQEMRRHRCVIADGHHRYTSELRVKEALGTESARYGLMCFVNAFNEGTTILPTNRVVSGLPLDTEDFLRKLRRHFAIEEVEKLDLLVHKVRDAALTNRKTGRKPPVFGVYSNANSKSYLLRLKASAHLEGVLPRHPQNARTSDVNILHEMIIKRVLGITDEQQKKGEHIDFIKGDDETIHRATDRDIQLAFFVNPPTVEEVFRVARSGETMPPKSTFFYPKVFSGLVIYKMEEE